MKKIRRIISLLLVLIVVLSPAANAGGVFLIPSGVTAIESDAFSDVRFENGIFIPKSCTSIAPDAFSDPASMKIYGLSGSAAEEFSKASGASFTAVDIKNVSVNGPEWASPDRKVTFSVRYESEESTSNTFLIHKDGVLVHESEPISGSAYEYAFYEGGSYSVTALIENAYASASASLAHTVTVADRIRTNQDVFYIEIGETVPLISASETRAVTLTESTGGLSVSGNSVTGILNGKYTVTASVETDEGTVYTDIPVEVIIPAEKITISSDQSFVLKNHTLSLSAVIDPESATYQSVVWSVDDESIASIDENGVLTGHEKGVVTVYASAGNVKDEIRIRVEKAVEAIDILPVNLPSALYSGMSFDLTHTVSPLDADNPTVTWTSLTPEIAKVDPFTGKVACLSPGKARILACANDLGGAMKEFAFTVYPGVTIIQFVSLPGVMRAGETFQLECEILPDSAPEKALAFASSDESIVTVSETGLIQAVAPGSAYVTAAAVNGHTASLSVTVMTPVSSVESALDEIYLNPGMTADPMSNFVFVKPESATYSSLTWTSDNGFVASVDKKTGVITASSDGTCVIKGVAHNGKSVSFTVHVVSDAKVVSKIAISSTYGSLNVGNIAYLTPSASPSTKYTTGTWYSDHPEILDVVFVDSSNKATIKAISPGFATIYAISSSGICARCTVVVNPIVVTGIYLNAASLSLNAGDTFPLAATIQPENATATNLTWTSSNESVATADANGVIHALSGGTCLITAISEDGVSASCRVTVNTIRMTDAFMNEDAIYVNAGESGYPSYTVTPENATPANFFWRSSDTSVVSVSSMTGEMKYLKAGSAVVSGTALDGSGLNIALTVNVSETPVVSFTLNAESLSLIPGETFHLLTRVLPVNASYASAVFTSDQPDIASVSENGIVTAVSTGSATITASVGRGDYTFSLSVPVTVEKTNDVTYRALIMGQFTVPATDGYLPFANNSTKGMTDALSRSSIDGNRYEITRLPGSPTPGVIRSAIQNLSRKADENDVTVIFFLTHGTNTGSEGYQMQTNSGVQIEPFDMIEALKEISGNVVFVLCTCHSGRILLTSGAASLKNAGGSYTGKNGKGLLSILCSSSTTNSSYYRVNDEKLSYDFYTYAVTRGLGWDMLNDYSTSTLLADLNGDGKVTVGELASYSRGSTQRAISSFIQQNGKTDFSGHPAQFPSWLIAKGHDDLVIFEK